MEDHSYPAITVKREGRFISICEYHQTLKRGEVKHFSSPDDVKLENNIHRAKSMILSYALCNQWDYFVTLTIDKSKLDRYDLKNYISKFGKFLNNYNERNNKDRENVKYLFIPEKHKDGAYHLHGLISGVNPDDLIVNAHGFLDWVPYSKRFGFVSLSPIKDHSAVSFYITKYVTKDMAFALKGERLYFCSKGLNKPEILYQGAGMMLCDPDYVADYGVSFKRFLFTENWEDAFMC